MSESPIISSEEKTEAPNSTSKQVDLPKPNPEIDVKFENNNSRARKAVTWLIVTLASIPVLSVVTFIYTFTILGVGEISGNSVDILYQPFFLIMFATVISLLLTQTVFFYMWLHRVYQNSMAISQIKPEISGTLFIISGLLPLVNLIIWYNSSWAVFTTIISLIGSIFFYIILYRIAKNSATQRSVNVVIYSAIAVAVSIMPLPYPELISQPASVASIILQFFLINYLTKDQQARAEELGLTEAAK